MSIAEPRADNGQELDSDWWDDTDSIPTWDSDTSSVERKARCESAPAPKWYVAPPPARPGRSAYEMWRGLTSTDCHRGRSSTQRHKHAVAVQWHPVVAWQILRTSSPSANAISVTHVERARDRSPKTCPMIHSFCASFFPNNASFPILTPLVPAHSMLLASPSLVSCSLATVCALLHACTRCVWGPLNLTSRPNSIIWYADADLNTVGLDPQPKGRDRGIRVPRRREKHRYCKNRWSLQQETSFARAENGQNGRPNVPRRQSDQDLIRLMTNPNLYCSGCL